MSKKECLSSKTDYFSCDGFNDLKSVKAYKKSLCDMQLHIYGDKHF